jgi:hypothetical protein
MLFAACRPIPRERSAAGDHTLAHPLEVAPVVRKATVVAFWLPATDTLSGGNAADLLDDFRSYTSRVAPALEDADIDLVATTADSIIVELERGPRRVIALGGLDYPFGYVLVEPGFAETILTGVSTDDDLLDQVGWYFGLEEEDTDSTPGHVVNAPAPRGRAVPAMQGKTVCAGTRYWAGGSRAAGWCRRCSLRRRES